MEKFIQDFFKKIKIGDFEEYEGFQVFPLIFEDGYKVDYLMMREALEKNLLKVKEVSESGSVPELIAKNKGKIPVLLLGGEELVGAKQNRILNVSILLPPEKETVIPVSCVERGRWSYERRDFRESEYIAYKEMRKANYEELYEREMYSIDQSRVWDNVDYLQKSFNVRSSTSAMKDVFDKKMGEISDYEEKISFHKNQIGFVAVSRGRILGFDIVGQSKRFKVVFRKILRSYIVEDMLSKKRKKTLLSVEDIEGFFEDIYKADEKRIESVGLGYDYRYRSEKVVGSVLGYENEVIHSVFLSRNDKESSRRREVDEDDEKFSDYKDRLNYLYK